MTPGDPNKKHRHDVGQVDHGAQATEPITRAIQFVLGGAIVASGALLLYALVVAAG